MLAVRRATRLGDAPHNAHPYRLALDANENEERRTVTLELCAVCVLLGASRFSCYVRSRERICAKQLYARSTRIQFGPLWRRRVAQPVEAD